MSLFKGSVPISMFFYFLSLIGLLGLPTGNHAADLEVAIKGGPRIYKKVVSLKEARFKRVVPQSVDYSCGAAALATLLNYHFGKEVTERDVVTGMMTHGDQTMIKERGFSLLDMKKYAETIGYQASGFKVNIEQLQKIQIPTIVLVNIRGYAHFVVLKGVAGDKVYTADPSWGNRWIDLEQFSKSWNNVVFVLAGPAEGNPPGLADATPNYKEQSIQTLIRIKDKALDNFAMDRSTPIFSGSYPWW